MWAARPISDLVRRRLGDDAVVVSSARAYARELERAPAVVVVDGPCALAIHPLGHGVPTIAVADESLPGALTLLERHPWLGHVVGIGLLEGPLGEGHLRAVVEAVTTGDAGSFLAAPVTARLGRLAASRARARLLDDIGDFLSRHGVGGRTVGTTRDVAEELLSNALYDAPVEAGFLEGPVSRTAEIALPTHKQCELGYGVSGADLVFVRVRDPFGSLARARMLSVLKRCARADQKVEIDGTMGGAGLGLWRIVSAAAFVAVTVDPGRSSELLVGIPRRSPGAQARARGTFALHLFMSGQRSRSR